VVGLGIGRGIETRRFLTRERRRCRFKKSSALLRINARKPHVSLGMSPFVNLHSTPAPYFPPRARKAADDRYAVVDLTRDHELSFWTEQLNCSADKLFAAVESVGPRVEHVSEYLRAGW
jgi:hypothetical protein